MGFQRVFRCRNCQARFFAPDGTEFDGSDAGVRDVEQALANSSVVEPIVHECEQGWIGIADYVGVGLS